MKKIIVLGMSVLLCTQVFANGADDPSSETSSVAVTNANGSTVVKVFYKAIRFGNVRVAILNDQGEVVFVEKVKNTSGFIRPYNFGGLQEGTYKILVSDAFGKRTETVNYMGGRIKTLIRFAKLPGANRYVMSGRAHHEEKLTIRFYDSTHTLVFETRHKVDGEFGEVYNMKYLPGSFSVEISDGQGILASAQY